MGEIAKGALFLVFSFTALISLCLAIKLYRAPSWKYKELRDKTKANGSSSGLVIDIKTNKWTALKGVTSEDVHELLTLKGR